MPVVEVEGPAVDPVAAGPATVFVEPGPAVAAPEPSFTLPPDVAWEPTPPRAPTRCQVLIGEAVWGDPIGELVTADVDDWVEDVEMLAGAPATMACSSWDPLLVELADKHWIGAHGWPVYQFDPKGFRVTIYLNGVRRYSGICRQPVDIGDGQIGWPISDGGVQFGERILGRAEQPDLLEDRGSFEGYESIAEMEADGWELNPLDGDEIEAQLVNDGVRGDTALRVRGSGWVRTPRVVVDGAEGYERAIDGSTFGKWTTPGTAGSDVVKTWVKRTDSLQINDSIRAASNQFAGRRPDETSSWTDDPVASGTRMTPEAVPHYGWVEVRSFPGENWSTYDLITLRSPTSTGFPPGTDRDYAYYVERILRDLVARSLGGSPTGLLPSIKALTGNMPPQALRWAHSARRVVRDILAQVLDADGGPECRITPAWNLEIWDQLGSDRDDICLTIHDVCGEPSFSIDPGARFDDFVADTGRGTGVTFISATVSQPFSETAHRIIAVVPAPDGMTLNSVTEWAKAHARVAARLHATAEVPVSMEFGEQLVTGDRFRVALEDGLAGLSERMRLIRRRWQPKEDRIVLTLGMAGDA